MREIPVALVLTLALVAAVTAQGQSRKTDPALTKLAAEFEATYNARDAAKVAALYAKDAVSMPPNQPMIKGRAAIEANLKRSMKEDDDRLKVTPMESAISGGQACEAGTVAVTRPDGRTESEKYVIVLKRVGADWKISYDIWNSDSAPQPQKK